MAQLKDLLVSGASRFIGKIYTSNDVEVGGKLKTNSISAPTSSNGTTYGTGSDGQILKSNGEKIYWDDFNNTDIAPLQSKTYEGVYSEQDNDTYGYKYYGNIKPADAKDQWHIKLRITGYVPNYPDYKCVNIFDITGMRTTYSSYYCWNNIQNTSYRCYYYNTLRYASSDANSTAYGHALGMYLRSCPNYTNTNYKRTYIIELLECDNCTFTFLDNFTIYDNLTNKSYLGGNNNYDACNQGLRETGDDNTYDRTYMSNAYLKNNATFRLSTYPLYAIDRNDKIQGISLYSDGYTGSTQSMSTTRVYNPNGMDTSKGLFYSSNGTNVAVNGDSNTHSYFAMSAMDVRYWDNCIYSYNPNNFGMQCRKAVYLRGVIKEDGLFYLQPYPATQVIVQGYYKSSTLFVHTSGGSTNISNYTSLSSNYIYQDITTKKYYTYNNGTYTETTNYSAKPTYQKVWTQDVPTSIERNSDGYQYVYWLIGYPYYSGSYVDGQYQLDLYDNNPVYWYKNGEFQLYDVKVNESSLATVATSGSYNDLSNKPSIPSGAAASKGVDTSISAASTSTNLPTSQAVASFVEGKGYKTTDTVTTATTTGSGNAVTSITASNGALTVTKGNTFVDTSSNQTISGRKTFSNVNDVLFTTNTTSNITPNVDAMSNPPWNADLYHDHFAFLRYHTIESQEYTENGTTWITDDKAISNLFMQKEGDASRTIILRANELAYRFVLKNISFGYSGANWYEIAVGYTSPFSQFEVKIEYSTDGETYAEIHKSIVTGNSAPYFFKNTTQYTSDGYLRFTFTKQNNLDTGTVGFHCIKAYCTRKGSQGLGAEIQFPYDWDANQNIFPVSNNTKTLGTSSKKWSTVYATTFNGNATSATTSSTSASLSQEQIDGDAALDGFLESGKFKYSTFKNSTNSGMASNDGMVLSIPWTSTTYGTQLAFDDTKNPKVKVRGKSTTWGDWKEILHEGNLSTLLSTVATSGSYNDLSNKPTIPSEVTESTISGWGFTKNTGTYSKPSGGIPKTDLASDVQTSLGKADTALQSYTEQYTGTVKKVNNISPDANGNVTLTLPSGGITTETDPVFSASAAAGIKSSDITNWNSKTSNTGTITEIKMNGASKGTSGSVDLGTVITSHQDISGKLNKSNVASKGSSTQPVYFDADGVATTVNKKDSLNNWINQLDTGSSTPTDNDYYVSQYVGGGTTTTTYHRRPVSALWEYIKSKISSVLGLTATNYGGKAATAGNADTVNGKTVAANVPADAKFTDNNTTYSAGSGLSLSGTTFSVNNSGLYPTESRVSWGGTAVAGNVSPIDAGCIDEFGHNKLAFIDPSCVTVEYTIDGGTTWTNYGYNNSNITALTTLAGNNFYIGKNTVSNTNGTLTDANCGNYKLRIKICSRDSSGNPKIYTNLMKILLNVSTAGASGSYVTIERRNIGDYNNNVNNWIAVGTYNLSGWSGWNSIPYINTFGGGTNQTSNPTAEIRMTFGITGVDKSTNKYNSVLSVSDIRFIGTTNWTAASELARAGHLYSMDASQNATFPAIVKGTNITSKGSATQPIYFDSNGVAQNTTYTLGKSVPSDAVFTDTNTWRGIQNNLTSDSTTESLSAAQGKELKRQIDLKTSNVGTVTKVNNTSPDANGNVSITIPSAVTESTVSGWGFTKNTGTLTSHQSIKTLHNKTLTGTGNVTLTAADVGALPSTTTIPTVTDTYSSTSSSAMSGKAVASALNNSGFTSNTGTVTSVNNVSPVNGNVTLTIPSAVTESTVSGWGFTKNSGTYSKPSGGIPKTDLASAVQTSLGKADTALQSYTEQYTGTVKKVNNTSPDANGNVSLDVPTITLTSSNDIVIPTQEAIDRIDSQLPPQAAQLWSGSLAKNGSITLPASVSNYRLLAVQINTSGLQYYMPMIFPKWSTASKVYLTADTGVDNGTSYLIKATFEYTPSSRSLKLVSASHHTVTSSGHTGTGVNVSVIYGIM